MIAVLAALLFSDVEKESELSREMIAVQEVKDGLESLKDGLQRLAIAHAGQDGPGRASFAQDLARERVGIEADLEYLRAKAAEQPRFAQAIAAVEGRRAIFSMPPRSRALRRLRPARWQWPSRSSPSPPCAAPWPR
ncbi:MAG: hypothetical protein IPJ28_07670 [Betaproteobacteria bacterium]|nr:hypothetical protein [Betaproteobacteria bacterium]